jgi:hypothetical protein
MTHCALIDIDLVSPIWGILRLDAVFFDLAQIGAFIAKP